MNYYGLPKVSYDLIDAPGVDGVALREVQRKCFEEWKARFDSAAARLSTAGAEACANLRPISDVIRKGLKIREDLELYGFSAQIDGERVPPAQVRWDRARRAFTLDVSHRCGKSESLRVLLDEASRDRTAWVTNPWTSPDRATDARPVHISYLAVALARGR